MSQPDATFQVFGLESHWLFEDARRLDASFYGKDAIASRILIGDMQKHGFMIEHVHDLADKVFWPGRFKRRYVPKHVGEPFLMPSEAIMLLPEAKKFVVNYPRDVAIKKDWLLISRSGTVGRCLLASRVLENHVLSDDLIRIIPKNRTNVGYLYAYLNTRIGRGFLTKDQYGSTVKHIEPHHVASIPIPRIPDFEHRISQMILQAHSLREESQQLLLEANRSLHTELGLPEIDEDSIGYLGGERGRIVKGFGIRATQLNSRLDASYHLPLARSVIQSLKTARSGTVKKLANVADSFVPPRFKRTYVTASHGLPLLQGTHVPQITPQDIKYIWKGMKNLDSYIIKKNSICVTCSGTIGRLSLVRDGWDGWAATNHLLRVTPKQNEIHPGYLSVFLLSIYGQAQFKRLIYGGVVDEIGEAGELFDDILVLKPASKELEDSIGNLAYEAYDNRDKANRLEDEAVNLLENQLHKLASSNNHT